MIRICFAALLFITLLARAEDPAAGPVEGPTFQTLFNQSPVCFSPDETCDDRLALFYELAEKSIDVAIYDINRPRLVETLIKKSHEVQVRIVADERQSKGSHSAVAQLVAGGVQVRFGRQRGIMHDKFSVIDGAVVETGSFNYTTHAATANQENQIYSVDGKVVSLYLTKFDMMWAASKPYGEKKLPHPGKKTKRK